MPNKAPGPKFVTQAIDSVISAYKETLQEQILKQIPVDDPIRTKHLRTHSSITVGERTEIPLNVCLENGIPYSAGIFKKVTLYNPAHPHIVIWVQFEQQYNGRKTCQETMQLYTKGIDKAWP